MVRRLRSRRQQGQQPISTPTSPILPNPETDPLDDAPDEDELLVRQQLDHELLLANAAASPLPDSPIPSASSDSTDSPTSTTSSWSGSDSSAQTPSSSSSWGEEDFPPRRPTRSTTSEFYLIYTLLLISIICVLLATYHATTKIPWSSIPQILTNEILIRFQRPIEKTCSAVEQRLKYCISSPLFLSPK
ncbi:MAG: hypothetical protein Q9225_007911 [Loekoesia sp. 1 TL-2023]